MSTDQPRHPSGTPTGGQFTGTVRPETGTALTVVPTHGDVSAELEYALRSKERELDRVFADARTLSGQLQELKASFVDYEATTAAQAAERARAVTELEFMLETCDMQADVLQDDQQDLRAHIAVVTDPAGVIARLRRGQDMDGPETRSHLLALTREVRAGRLDTHPWLDAAVESRRERLAESLTATPTHPAARAWQADLDVIEDPHAVARAEVAARRTGTDRDARRLADLQAAARRLRERPTIVGRDVA